MSSPQYNTLCNPPSTLQHPSVHSFPPIASAASKILILGSMPDKMSLTKGQYYAHPRNLFWPFMESLFAIDALAPYATRIAQLLARRVALWDVLKSCKRRSSLDTDIVSTSMVANSLHHLFAACPSLRVVCFNGAKAADTFHRHVLPDLPQAHTFTFHRLPSTSPANASLSLEHKMTAWRNALAI